MFPLSFPYFRVREKPACTLSNPSNKKEPRYVQTHPPPLFRHRRRTGRHNRFGRLPPDFPRARRRNCRHRHAVSAVAHRPARRPRQFPCRTAQRRPARPQNHHARAGARKLRFGGGRLRHQRPDRGLCLPQSASAGQNPDCGQPRRFRRTRQAQRIHGGRQNADYLRRQRKPGFARRHVFAQSQTAGEGNRHRLQKIRAVFPAGFVPQNVGAETRRVLRQKHVR